MAYNGYPATYQPMIYQPYQFQNMQQQSSQQNGVIWVQGEAGAKSYLVAPNCTVQLWDSERQTIYLKSADASGMPSLKVLDYTIRENTQNQPSKPVSAQAGDCASYATKAEFAALQADFAALRAELDGLTAKRTVRTKKDEVEA